MILVGSDLMYMPVESDHFNGTPSYRNFYLSICAIRDSPLMNIYIPDKPFLVTLDFSSALFRASGLGNITGNPGVRQANPYPYPSDPYPQPSRVYPSK